MNASNQAAQRLLSAHEELHRQQHLNDIKVVMSVPEGRRLIWELLGDAGVFRQSFVVDAMSTAFNEGKRSIGLALISRLTSEIPDLYLKAQGEQIEMQKTAQTLRDAAEAESEKEQEDNE